MLTAVLAGFILAIAAPYLTPRLRGAAGWCFALLPLSLVVYLGFAAGPVIAGRALRERIDWIPALDVSLSFYLDGLSLLFALLICGVGVFILIYAGGYLSHHAQLGRFFAFLISFMASMLGLVLSDNVFTMFVFWELTSITSFLLIGFDHTRERSRAAALQALLVTGTGGLAMLAGLVLLGVMSGSFELSDIIAREGLQSQPLYPAAVILILLGCFTKSAQVPFHFWLPAAMEAPTPVSAYLHSATMVKAGIYLMARLTPALGESPLWTWSLVIAGLATMVVGALTALQKTDLKQILAYSTVSALGMLTLTLGAGEPVAAVVLLTAHALYKAALFMTAGSLDHEAGTRDVTKLGGLARAMPRTAIGGLVAALSMAGLPPLFGFISKELFYEAALHSAIIPGVLTGSVVVASAALVAAAGLAGLKPFIGRSQQQQSVHEAPISMWLGPVVFAAGGLVLGMAPGLVASSLGAAASAVAGQTTVADLSLWHGVTTALVLSAVTFGMGLVAFFLMGWIRAVGGWIRGLTRLGPERWYELSLDGLNLLARSQTRILQSGYLRVYLMMIILSTVGLAAYTLMREPGSARLESLAEIRAYEWAVALLIVLAALVAVRSSSRLAAVAALGMVGYGVGMIFVLFGAPDLGMTQFAVDTLTVIIFVLLLYRLPRYAVFSTARSRARDAVVAVSAGALMTVLVLLATVAAPPERISEYFVENSVPLAHGRNIVNVILVDFRALDTLGEITVLMVAAAGVVSLMRLRAKKEGSE